MASKDNNSLTILKINAASPNIHMSYDRGGVGEGFFFWGLTISLPRFVDSSTYIHVLLHPVLMLDTTP